MSDVETAWVAGLLEGEGSFGFGPTSRVRQLRITCAMTDEDTIQKLQHITGVGQYNKEGRLDPRRLERAKPLYVWQCSKRLDAEELLWAIRPHMGSRRGARIDELLAYAEANPLKYNKTKEVPHGTANGYVHYKCRCVYCTAAASARSADYRERKKRAGVAVA